MKLIQTQEYLLLIDEEAEIKRGDYLLEKESIINVFPDYLTDLEECKKIIAYRKLNEEAKELDLPKLPPFEVNIEKLACEKYSIKEGLNDYDERYYNSHNVAKAEAFIEGYKAAQSKGQYSLEDIKDALNQLADEAEYGISNFAREDIITKIIQSLFTQQLPKEFIPEYNVHMEAMDMPRIHIQKEVKTLKTITNSEGKQELVGTYKY